MYDWNKKNIYSYSYSKGGSCRFDTDKDGVISSKELGQVLRSITYYFYPQDGMSAG